MKIVTWNCNGGLRNKTAEVDSLNADVLIIQECEDPSSFTEKYRNWAGKYLWVGISKNKGIGVFSRNAHIIKDLKWSGTHSIDDFNNTCTSLCWNTKDLKLFLPFLINEEYTVVAVWTKRSEKEIFRYMGQFWKFIQIHKKDLNNVNTLILGDFNSNAIWDKPYSAWSHTAVMDELSEIGINSLYHHQYSEEQGSETKATFYMHRKLAKPYHIDYIFCSNNLLVKSKIEIGDEDYWLKVSDHIPLTIKLGFGIQG